MTLPTRMQQFVSVALLAISVCALQACKDDNGSVDTPPPPPPRVVKTPSFNADTAYAYVAKQVSFGPRVPGTKSQADCAAWMHAQLSAHTDLVYEQRTTVRTGGGKMVPCINLIGAIHPQAPNRILLLSHWDSRPWADQDTRDQDKPIDGADDGASGVGVLLELARAMKSMPLPTDFGVDFLMVDVEDYGKTEWGDSSYSLGTQYWARHPHVPGYKARFGILLDMVGARNAQFPKEQISAQYAGDVQTFIWNAAVRAGYSSYFSWKNGAAITDDHLFVNELTGIPTVDIIHLRTGNPSSVFPEHWHTHADNLSIIDAATLKAVGQTVLQVIYETAAESNAVALQSSLR